MAETTNGQSGGHNHDIVINKQKILVHNELKVGDKVVLIRMQGGQVYYVADRI